MHIDIELSGLRDDAWFEQLRDAVSRSIDYAEIELEELRRPAGVFGAGDTPSLRAKIGGLDKPAQVATILAAVVSLYTAMALPPKLCEIALITEVNTVVLTYECQSGIPQEMKELIRKHTDKHGMPQKIKVAPRMDI